MLSPTVKNVLAVLPAIQKAVREEIAARIVAGEDVGSEDSPDVREALARDRHQSQQARTGTHKSAA